MPTTGATGATGGASTSGPGRAAEPDECQLHILGDSATTLARRDQLRNRLLRLRSYLIDHLEEAHKRRSGRPATPPATARPLRAATPLKAGDVVEVLSLDEIRQTLDQADRCGGLKFMKPMAAHCGRRYVVLANVRHIYDEHHERMLRLRRTVVLRDVICHGLYVGDLEGCDRCCFFFWKEDWLSKVGERERVDTMKIAFLYYYTYRLPRGVETLIASLANALVRRGEEVAIVTARPTLEPLVPPDPRVQVYAYPTSRYFEHTLIAPLFAGHFLRHHYDAVVVFYADFGEGQAWQWLERLGVHLPLTLYLCSPYSAVPHRYQAMARLDWGRRARHILADADWVATEAAGFFQRAVPVVPIGTDPERFRPLPAVRAAARQQWGYAKNDVVLLNVSALEARKGTGRALLALGRLCEQFPALHFLILGHGDQEPALRSLTQALGLTDRVRFAGVSPHLEEFYNLADVFVMLPDDEANSIACHEAMSCGLPVVAAIRGGFRESVPPEAGLLVDPECPQAVDAALAELIAAPDLRQRMGQAGRASILAHHTWDQVAARFMEVLT